MRLEELTGGLRLPEWLSELYELYTSDKSDVYLTAAAVGTVARLGAACVEKPDELFTQLVRGEISGPREEARKWARGLSHGEIVELLGAFVEQAGVTLEGLHELRSGSPRDDEVRTVCLDRDRLESVFWVLSQIAEGLFARDVLDPVDRLGGVTITENLLEQVRVDDRLLSTVSWQEPEAWWGVTPW